MTTTQLPPNETRKVISAAKGNRSGLLTAEMIQRVPPNCLLFRLEMKLLVPPEPIMSVEDRMDIVAARTALAEGDRVSEDEAAHELGLR